MTSGIGGMEYDNIFMWPAQVDLMGEVVFVVVSSLGLSSYG